MADYISAYSGSQIDGSVASSSLYFSGAGATAHISASGNISASALWVTNNISASAIYADTGYFSGSSIFLDNEKWEKSHISNIKKGRRAEALSITTFTDADTTPSISGGSVFRTKVEIGTTIITTFDDGDVGDEITIICTNSGTRFNDGSGIHTQGSVQMRCGIDDVYKFVYDGTNWFTVSVSDNS